MSLGVAIGRAFVDWKEHIEVEKEYVDDVELELDRLNAAIEVVEQEIREVYDGVSSRLLRDEVEIFTSHGMMISDPEFIGQVKGRIITESVNAEWAVRSVADKFIQVFEDMDDVYLKAKADDLKDLSARLCRLLLHVEGGDLSKINEPSIIVFRNLDVGDLARVDRDKVLGIVSQEGTRSSHGVIKARQWELPAVIGVSTILEMVETGELLVIDGSDGTVIRNPDEATLERYREKQRSFIGFHQQLAEMAHRPTLTQDGYPLRLYANVDTLRDVERALQKGIRGVGLFRTEQLYMDRDRLPTEGEQFGVYKKAVLATQGRTVIFRTLDIGCDKVPSYLNVPRELNPALGYRAIRLSLARADIFRIQLRALLRASAFGKAKIMFPMISGVEELRQARGLLEDVKSALRKEGIPFNPDVEVGVMVEVPSAAVVSDLLAKEVEFMSIGTNDLIQYSLAVDRSNDNLSGLYSPFHPAVLRLVYMTIKNGLQEGIKVSLCGEMASEPLLIPLLIGMGLERFSVNSDGVLMTRWIMAQVDRSLMRETVEQVMSLTSTEKVRRFCEECFAPLKDYHG